MKVEQQEEIRKTILDEIARTKQAITEYEEMTKPIGPENSIGRISRMDAIHNKSVTEAALRQAKTKLSNLKYALNRVGESDFGLCKRCKNLIPEKRLLLMPQSPFCVRCAQ